MIICPVSDDHCPKRQVRHLTACKGKVNTARSNQAPSCCAVVCIYVVTLSVCGSVVSSCLWGSGSSPSVRLSLSLWQGEVVQGEVVQDVGVSGLCLTGVASCDDLRVFGTELWRHTPMLTDNLIPVTSSIHLVVVVIVVKTKGRLKMVNTRITLSIMQRHN